MAKPRRLDWGERSGITIEYVKSRDTFYVSGWYDSFVGIKGGVMTRAEFEERLGIPASPPAPVPEDGTGGAE